MSDEGAIGRRLRRDRLVTAVGLAILCLLAWAYVLTGAGMGMSPGAATTLALFPHKAAVAPMAAQAPGMDMADMPGMAATGPAAPAPWTPRLWLLTVAMWGTMMVAMMTPSATPAILLYGRVRAQAGQQGRGAGLAPTVVFAAGYLLVWLGFSAAAAALQWILEQRGLVSSLSMGSQSRWLSAAVLVLTGAYQLSPFKSLCLTQCRSPTGFITRHWRAGTAGAVRLGVLHGGYCVGCCWVLMALLFVGGVMNLAWIAALTVLVMAEKLLPGGPWVARTAGGLLILWGVATILV